MPANDQLRPLWTARGLSSKAGSAAAALPPPPGFRRVYHLTSAEHAIADLVFGRLKIARFSQLNDLFELLAPNFKSRGIRQIVTEHKKVLDASQGLLCFSSDWVDPPLWAHYGARHRGICLGFNLRDEFVLDVKYQEERLLLGDLHSITPDIADRLVRTKAKSWEYERECRMLIVLDTAVSEGEHYFRKFDDDFQLAEIVLGALCSLDVGETRRLAKQHHSSAVVFKSRPALKSFKMVPDEYTVQRVPDENPALLS